MHQDNTMASSTPATDGERVFAAFVDDQGMKVVALDFDGKIIWTARPGTYFSNHGFAASPVIYGGGVIINGHQDGTAFVVMLDRKTGDELWRLDLAANQFTRANPLRHLKASGYELVSNASELRSEIHPDDRAEFDLSLTTHLKNQSDHWDVSYRASDVEGNWRWLRTRGRVVARAPDGRALRMVGTTGDVTEFKHHEIELEVLNLELESRVSPVWIDRLP